MRTPTTSKLFDLTAFLLWALFVYWVASFLFDRGKVDRPMPYNYDIVLGWHTFEATSYRLDEGELVFITTEGDKVTTMYSPDVRIVELNARRVLDK
jgi:hypothetical protein